MKMSDVFDLPVNPSQIEVYGASSNEGISFDEIESAAAHDINKHDRLTEENAKLREMLTQLQIEGGLGIARHRQIDRLLNQLKEQTNDK